MFPILPPMSNLILFILFLTITPTNSANTTSHFDLSQLSHFKLTGEAHIINGTVRLTRDVIVPNSGCGKVLYSSPVRLRIGTDTASLSTSFTFTVSNLNPSSIGGGLSFLISPDDVALCSPGPLLGLSPTTLSGFVAVEFDTLMDVQLDDINGNHIGLDLNSLFSNQVADLQSISIDLKSGNSITSWLDYSPITRLLNVYVSYANYKPLDPLLSIPLDLSSYVQDYMYVGFTASTQASTESHSIHSWNFKSSFEQRQSPPPPYFWAPPNPPVSAPALSRSPLDADSNSDLKTSSCHNRLCKQGPGAMAGVVTAGAFFLAAFGVLVWVITKKKRLKRMPSIASDIIKMPKEFGYRELKSATNCFNSNRIIGHGAFGTVYKGIIPENGDVVAVKRCSHNTQGNAEFLSELSIIGMLRHRNLVRLHGWCHERGEILLVYDLMPNGSLDKALFESRVTLPWNHRHKILSGVASALAYLHHECENQVIHRDVKSSNIMLDEGFNARVGDFGLARETEHEKSPQASAAAGTLGYLAPEYLLCGRATEKSDVFSYGAVALEVATGRRTIEREGHFRVGSGHNSLVDWVWGLHREGRLITAADGKLMGDFDEVEMMRVLLVGLACSNPDPMFRPTMPSVRQMLVGDAELPAVPICKPSTCFSTSHLLMSLQDSVSDFNDMIVISTSSSSSSSRRHSFVG